MPPADFVFPPFSGDALPGVPVTVTFTAVDPITGTLDLATGALTTTSSTYHAKVEGFGGACNYDLELGFNTNPKSPFNGVPFTVATGSPTSISHGAYSTSWTAGETRRTTPPAATRRSTSWSPEPAAWQSETAST